MDWMRIRLNLRIARRSLATFKLRTALAVLGVFLGTFSLVVVNALTRSMTEKTIRDLASLGENLLIVQCGTVHTFGGRAWIISQAKTLTEEDGRAILDGISGVAAISPASGKTFTVRFQNTVLDSVMITGVRPNYADLRNLTLAGGRFLSEDDVRRIRRAVVLGRKIAEKLFPEENPVGRTILIRRVPCVVVGVLEAKGSDVTGFDQDKQIFIPLSTFLKRFVNQTYVTTIYVKVHGEEVLKRVKHDVELLLRLRHGIQPGERDDFTVLDLRDVTAMKTKAIHMISVLGKIAAAVSFVIGGVGILSIMILMVNERRLEIGLRRAMGARRRDVMVQFLLESSAIALLGGGVGIGLGLAGTLAAFTFLHYPVTVSLSGLGTAFVASVSVGILAGIHPSRRALAIQPVDVMRS